MTMSSVRKKLRGLEEQLEALKRAVRHVPDAAADERNWVSLRGTIKRSRRTLFRRHYGKA